MGKRVIGATVELNGEEKFKSAVTGINKEISTLKSSMSLLKEQTIGQSNTADTLKKKQDILNNTLTKYQEKQKAICDGLKNSEARYEKAQKDVNDYEKELREAEKALAELEKSETATTEELEEQRKAVKAMQDAHEANLLVQEKAKQSVEDWKNKLVISNTQIQKANHALEENDKYLQEARSSSDGCATSIDGFGKKTNATTQRLDDLNRSVNTFAGNSKVVEYLEKASETMRKLSENAYNAALELDTGYDTIIKKTGATGESFEKFKKVADDIFGDMPVEIEDVGKAVGDVSTRFGMTGNELKEVSEIFLKFSKINDTDVSNSVRNADRIMEIFKVDSKDTADVLGMFTSIGQKTGMTMDSLMGTLDKNGDMFQELGFSLEDSAWMLAEFESKGVDASSVLAALKKEIANASKEGKTANGMLSETTNAIINASTETEALQTATKAFGSKGALVMVRGLRDGRISLGNTSNAMKKYGDVVTKTFEEMLDPWDETKVAMNNLKTAGADLAGTALHTLQPAIEGVTRMVKTAKEWFEGLPDPMKNTVAIGGTIVGLMGMAIPKTLALGANIEMISAAQSVASASAAAHSAALGTQVLATEGASIATANLNAIMSACPVAILALGVSGLVAGLAVLAEQAVFGSEHVRGLTDELYDAQGASEGARISLERASDSLAETFDNAKESIDDAVASSELASRLTDELLVLNNQTNRTAEEQARMESIVSELNTIYPELGLSIDKTTNSLNKTNDEITAFIANAKNMSMVKAYQEAYAEVMEEVVEATKEQIKAEMERDDLIDANKKAEDEYAAVLKKKTEALEAGNGTMIEYNGELVDANNLLGDLKDSQNGATNEIDRANAAIEENKGRVDEALDYAQKLSEKCDELGGSVTGVAEATDGATASTENLTQAQITASEEAILAEQAAAEAAQEAAEKQQEAHDKLVESTRNSVHQQIGLFEELKLNSEVSLESMNTALASQQEYLSSYSANIETAMQYAMESGSESCAAFVQSIASMGEDGAAYMAQFVEAINRNDGSAEQILANFAAAEDAKNKYADQMVAMEERTQKSTDEMVGAVAGAEGDMASAASKTAGAGAQAAADMAGEYDQAGDTLGESTASGMASASGAVESAASSLVSAGERELRHSDAYSWGLDMGYEFANGLASTYNYVASSASSIAEAAAEYMSHSTPKKGPLHGDDKWGYEMGENFARGMQTTRGMVGIAAEGLATAAADGMNHDIAARTVRFDGAMSGSAVSGAAIRESSKPVVVENRFYLGERDITDLITNKVIKKITSIRQNKNLAKGAFVYV